MTEKKLADSSKSDRIQNFNNLPEDEISLLEMVSVLVKKKVFIFCSVAIFTVSAILYALSVPPSYLATIGFLPPPGTTLISHFPVSTSDVFSGVPNRGVIERKNESMFNDFLTVFQSYHLQEKVFNEKDFLNEFIDNNPDVDNKSNVVMTKDILGEINKSIRVSKNRNGLGKGSNPTDNATFFEFEGVKPQAMADFLNSLAEYAMDEMVNNTKKSIEKEIKTYKDSYLAKLEFIRSKEKLERLKKINRLSGELEIAKNLGVVGNNFKAHIPNTMVTVHPRNALVTFEEGILPFWYLYGQRALEQELIILKRQHSVVGNNEKVTELTSEVESLSKIDLSKLKFRAAIVSQSSVPPIRPNNPAKGVVIFIGVVVGLFVGILGAFLISMVDRVKARLGVSND